MLSMPALEFRYPVAFVILMKTNDTPFHIGWFPRLSNENVNQLRALHARAHTASVFGRSLLAQRAVG